MLFKDKSHLFPPKASWGSLLFPDKKILQRQVNLNIHYPYVVTQCVALSTCFGFRASIFYEKKKKKDIVIGKENSL